MFGWEFPPHISGGLGTACYGIVKGLASGKNVDITFVVPKIYGNEHSAKNIQLLSADNISVGSQYSSEWNPTRVSILEVSSKLIPYATPESYVERYKLSDEIKTETIHEGQKIPFSGGYGPNLFSDIYKYAVVAKTIAKDNQFQLIHAHDWLTFPAGIAAKQISGKPLIVHVHSTDFDRSGGTVNPDIFAIEKQGFEEADHIITVSKRIKNRLTEQYHISPKKITTVYNAIDPKINDSQAIKNRKYKIVTFLGRITIQKGPEYFVDVARMVIHRMKNVDFVIAGNGELRDHILELCARYGITDRIHFTGFLNNEEVKHMLRQSDLFIMPSVSEPFGIVPLEAMQAEVPVIISLQSGVSELIRNVVKTDFWDVHAMADAVHGILRNKKLAASMITDGKKEVNRLSWNRSANQIRQVYLKTLSNIAS
jgi:glycosyltransferase involved in cell wall biosynthesis